MKKALFIFRRDLRLHDNKGLNAALKAAEEVIPAFIFTPEQIEHNSFRSDSCLQFMLESLEDLDAELKGSLHYFFGKPEEVIEQCIIQLGVQGVFINFDYTPYSLKRDAAIENVCKRNRVIFHGEHDLLLHPIETGLKKNGEPYTVFTPYFKHASQFEVSHPVKQAMGKFSKKGTGKEILEKLGLKKRRQQKGGRGEGLKILENLSPFQKYEEERDFPALEKTTHLSPHLKFTTCSIREIYHAIKKSLGEEAELIRSLYWRDFFTLIAFHFPHVFEGAFRKKFNYLEWSEDETAFQRWCEGKTGFPLVDAGMRELNETGFMHNRLRLITANFLVKDLHLNWQWGEKYFAQRLIDYDPCVNNGNWQWCASTGCDAQPYFRIFNPWSQAKKFDPHCTYIKRWIPELASFPPKAIHDWQQAHTGSYPPPMLDHVWEKELALNYYKIIK